LRKHYHNERKDRPPKKHNLFLLSLFQKQTIIYGHFNNLRGFGVKDYYPNVDQFISILRDPFELTVSSYFYVRANSKNWKDQDAVPSGSLAQFISDTDINMLNHFPRVITRDNYKEIIEQYFVYIGIVEHLQESLRMIAHKLGKNFNSSEVPHANATSRDQIIDDGAKSRFKEKHELEYLVYEYAKQRHLEQAQLFSCENSQNTDI